VAKLETLEVHLPDEIPEGLWGGSLDMPHAGDTADEFSLPLIGWIVGREAPAVAAEIVHEGEVLRVAPLDAPRPDIALHYTKVPEASHAGWRATIDTLALPEEFQLEIRAVLENGHRAPVASLRGRRETPQSHETPAESAPQAPEIPTLQYELRDLIVEAAEACLDREVGEKLIGPKRGSAADSYADAELTARIRVLDRIELEGKAVLDVGSALGEVSRAARERGAALVDGFEPDPDKVSLARLAVAYHQVGRVSFYQGDLLDQEASNMDHYDVVLALSAPERVTPALDRVGALTDGILVAAVPGGENGEGFEAFKERFPVHEVLGEAPGGSSFIAFAKTGQALADQLRHPAGDAAGARAR
jgi:SAM-dependent methyltransferase